MGKKSTHTKSAQSQQGQDVVADMTKIVSGEGGTPPSTDKNCQSQALKHGDPKYLGHKDVTKMLPLLAPVGKNYPCEARAVVQRLACIADGIRTGTREPWTQDQRLQALSLLADIAGLTKRGPQVAIQNNMPSIESIQTALNAMGKNDPSVGAGRVEQADNVRVSNITPDLH